jgi:polar amino acid transport system substrate-binding protein
MDRPPLPPSRRWWIGAGLAVLIAAGVAALLLKGQFASAPAPQWTFDNQPVFLGQTIPFTWQYTAPASAESVCFEIVSARDEAFQFESRTETCTDAEHYFAGDINGARYWRVRAVDIRTGEPLSPWSPAIKVAQFESVYERIKATGELDIYASRSQDQDIFKFVKNKGVQGVDFKLSRLILDELSRRLDRAIEADWKSVAWQELLPKAGEGLADFVISSITETPEREREFHITFSDSYFCTTHALIFRAGTADGAIAAMIAGKKVGVQSATTNARLAEGLAAGGVFEVIAFPNTESLENALLGAQIDFGITDTSFARAAQLDTRLGNGMNRLDLKEFAPGDLPASLQDQQTQQYAIAVRTGEFELLDTINDVIAKAKQDGSLARAFKESAEEYEEAFGLPPGSRRQDARPWDCANQTATAQ